MARKTMERRTTTYRTEVQGNVVRKLHTVTVPEQPQKVSGPREVTRRSRKNVRNTLSIPYCMFLTAACVLTLILGAYYLEQQALSTSSQKEIADLENDLTNLKKFNADELTSIEMKYNLDQIRDVAINELGMVYANADNVVLYKNTRQNYVSQHDEMPQEEESLMKSIMKSK